jgi:hypothetical protein
MVTGARTRGALALPRGANRKSRRSAGAYRIATGERKNKGWDASATSLLPSLVPSRRLGAADQWLASERCRLTTEVCRMQRNGRKRPPNHCPRRCLIPLASRLMNEYPGSRLRASEQRPLGGDCRLRSRRSAGDRSLAVSAKGAEPTPPLTPPDARRRPPRGHSFRIVAKKHRTVCMQINQSSGNH